MTRLRDYYYNEYMMLLQNKVQKQRQEIEQRSQAMNEKENRKVKTFFFEEGGAIIRLFL